MKSNQPKDNKIDKDSNNEILVYLFKQSNKNQALVSSIPSVILRSAKANKTIILFPISKMLAVFVFLNYSKIQESINRKHN